MKLPDIISPDTQFSSLEKVNNGCSGSMDDYLNDDLNCRNNGQGSYQENFIENSQGGQEVFSMWADHQNIDTSNLPLDNRPENNNFIKPYLNGGVYEKSDKQI